MKTVDLVEIDDRFYIDNSESVIESDPLSIIHAIQNGVQFKMDESHISDTYRREVLNPVRDLHEKEKEILK